MSNQDVMSPDQAAISLLYLGSLRQQLLIGFFQRSATTLSPFGGSRWHSIIPDLAAPAKPLESAALALAMARMGLDLRDSRYTQESLKLYTKGLKQVQLALWNPNRMYADETLGACMLLIMYEVVECPSKGRLGYLSHHSGCARLVQLRGPKAHVDGLGHSIFLQFRYIGKLILVDIFLPLIEVYTGHRNPHDKVHVLG
jgi:hypothetical protein